MKKFLLFPKKYFAASQKNSTLQTVKNIYFTLIISKIYKNDRIKQRKTKSLAAYHG